MIDLTKTYKYRNPVSTEANKIFLTGEITGIDPEKREAKLLVQGMEIWQYGRWWRNIAFSDAFTITVKLEDLDRVN